MVNLLYQGNTLFSMVRVCNTIITIQGVPKKMTQLVFVKASSNLHQIWQFLACR